MNNNYLIQVWPTEPSNPSKVRVYGPGVERGVKMNIPTHFTVDCKEAGPGKKKIIKSFFFLFNKLFQETYQLP